MIPCLKNLRSTNAVALIRQVKAPTVGANWSMSSDSSAEASCHLDIEAHVSRKEAAPLSMGGLKKAPFPAKRQEGMAAKSACYHACAVMRVKQIRGNHGKLEILGGTQALCTSSPGQPARADQSGHLLFMTSICTAC